MIDATKHVTQLRRRFGPHGVHIDRLTQVLATRSVHFARLAHVERVVDIGAADGGFARRLRRSGWAGPIESFEPRSDAYRSLNRASTSDELWRAYHLALGSSAGKMVINVSENGVSSSLRTMTREHLRAAPSSRISEQETVTVARLDDLEIANLDARLFLKLDVQGFEDEVLDGAQNTVKRAVVMVQAELSLVELYAGQRLAQDLIEVLDGLGFDLWWVDRGTRSPDTGRLLQMDGLFLRRDAVSDARQWP